MSRHVYTHIYNIRIYIYRYISKLRHGHRLLDTDIQISVSLHIANLLVHRNSVNPSAPSEANEFIIPINVYEYIWVNYNTSPTSMN